LPFGRAGLGVGAVVVGVAVFGAVAEGRSCSREMVDDAACEVSTTPADLDAVTIPATGDVLIVTDGLTIHRSTDHGRTFSTEDPAIEGRWPSVLAHGTDLLLAAGFWGSVESRIFVVRSPDGGQTFGTPAVVAESFGARLIDPELVRLADGRLLLFFTEITGVSIIHLMESVDGGLSWSPVATPIIGPAGARVEDGKAIVLASGVVLFGYELEFVEQGRSRLEQIASADVGRTWSLPTVLWDHVGDADVEPGGYLVTSTGELWFVASTDEDNVDVGRVYANAIVKRRTSSDGGETWSDPATLVPVPDQIIFGVTAIGDGLVGLATVRHYSDPPRVATFYRVPDTRPGEVLCSDTLFVSSFEYGLDGGWSAVRP
jgi:hypothetical protein